MENDQDNTEYVLMYRCDNMKCPKTVWIACRSVEKRKCSKCRRTCHPVDEIDVSYFLKVQKILDLL